MLGQLRKLEPKPASIGRLSWGFWRYVVQDTTLSVLTDMITVGRFQWGGREFTNRAQDIRFNPEEGGSRVPVLRARLLDDSNRPLEGDVNLAERINNRGGSLQFNW